MLENRKSSSKKKKKHQVINKNITIPKEILDAMKKEFPGIKKMEFFVDRLFTKILEKVFSDGSCTVTRFGNFFAYKVFSNRSNQVVPRVKFSLSRAMRKKIQDDPFVMRNIMERERNTQYYRKKKPDTGEDNDDFQTKKATPEQLAKKQIASILEESFE